MASEIEICNLGLSNIRAGSINSLTEASIQAQNCALKYPLMRDRMLTDALWGFARAIKPLALLSNDGVFNWNYSYQYPSDCLKINRLIGEQEELSNADAVVLSRFNNISMDELRHKIPYEVFNVDGNKVIASNQANLRAEYHVKVEDPNMFNIDFIIAFSHLLSSELAIPLVGGEVGRQLRSDSLTLYKSYLDAAIANDGNEQYHEPPLSEFETVRR